MLSGFEALTTSELDALLEAPVLIVALIGAADGIFDAEEREWSDRLVNVFTYAKPKTVNDFYTRVSDNFIGKVSDKLSSLESDEDVREEELSAQLNALNPILAKLPPALGVVLYKSFLSLAKETAKASGGFLRIGAIAEAEHRWINLPMLTPIHLPAGVDPAVEEE